MVRSSLLMLLHLCYDGVRRFENFGFKDPLKMHTHDNYNGTNKASDIYTKNAIFHSIFKEIRGYSIVSFN